MKSFNHLYAQIDYRFDKLERETLAKLRGPSNKRLSIQINLKPVGVKEVADAFAKIGLMVKEWNHTGGMNVPFNIKQINGDE